MRKTTLDLPQLGLIAATRGMLGAGIGLLAGGKLSPEVRKAVGWTLVAVGVATTIPLAMEVFGGQKEAAGAAGSTPASTWEEQEAERTAAAA